MTMGPEPTRPPRQRQRLAPAGRRAQLLESACATFSEHGYRQCSMAQLAAAAGVTAALYYRHFPSKAELFEACMRAAAAELLSSWEEALHDPDPSAWLLRMGAAPHAEMGAPNLLALWFHATTEAPNNRDMRAMLADQLGEIHAFVARVVQQSQERPGGVRPDLDAEAEAWIFLSTGLMLATSIRVGGQMQEQLPRVVAGRRTWLYGSLKGR